MKRYDLLSISWLEDQIMIETTDERTVDWVMATYGGSKDEPTHLRYFVHIENCDPIVWKIVSDLCHNGWEPLQVGHSETGWVDRVVLRQVTTTSDTH